METSLINGTGASHTRFLAFRWLAGVTGWRLVSLGVAALVIVPVAVVLWSLWLPRPEVWPHLMDNVLPDVLRNTFWLVCSVGAGTLVLGVTLAWLTAACEFPGQRVFAWALFLPLALPAYVTAFVAIGLLDYTGPLQSFLRETFGFTAFPPIRSRGGVILVMTLALYPYVYLIARNAFLTQGLRTLEVAQSLGMTRWRAFFRVTLPMARPWIVAGVMLVIMETLADFGTVAIFNYDTFTTAIYKAWFALFSLPAALQLASFLVLIVLAVILLEQQTRHRMQYTATGRSSATPRRIVLGAHSRWAAFGLCALVLGAAFVVPIGQLLVWAAEASVHDLDARYWGFLTRSLTLAVVAALLTTGVALIVAYSGRRHSDLGMRLTTRLANLGYALPGPVLAVGIYAPVAWFDNWVIDSTRTHFQIELGQILGGTLLVMLLAYLARFLTVAFNPIDSHLQRVTRSLDDAARSLGVRGLAMLRRVHLPILRGGVLTAVVLVFVDVMKEMPITLMTRPFGWDTLAVRIFELTSEGEWQRAALPAVALVVAGLVPMIFLIRHTER